MPIQTGERNADGDDRRSDGGDGRRRFHRLQPGRGTRAARPARGRHRRFLPAGEMGATCGTPTSTIWWSGRRRFPGSSRTPGASRRSCTSAPARRPPPAIWLYCWPGTCISPTPSGRGARAMPSRWSMPRRPPPTATAPSDFPTQMTLTELERLRPLNPYGWSKHLVDLRVLRCGRRRRSRRRRRGTA